MEVKMVHPDNKDQEVLVTNERQYAAFKKMGFEDAPEKDKDDLKAAQTPALKAHPMADSSKVASEDVGAGKADTTDATDKKNQAADMKKQDQKADSSEKQNEESAQKTAQKETQKDANKTGSVHNVPVRKEGVNRG